MEGHAQPLGGTLTIQEYDVVTIGDMCVDLIMPLGDVLPQFGQVEQWVADHFVELGGSTGIFACQAARWGLRIDVLGRVGDDAFGRLVLDRLTQSGVDIRHVRVDAGLKTGIGIALCWLNGDGAILTYGGSLNAVYPSDVSDDFLRSGRHLHYGSYYLQTNLLPVAPQIMERARQLGLTVSLDTNWDSAGKWAQGRSQTLEHADLFFRNERETRALGKSDELSEPANRLATHGLIVAVKLGGLGCLVQANGEQIVAPAEPVAQPVDTVGAGDSFGAGFLVAWLQVSPLAACAAAGHRCGRATTLARGGIAGQFHRSSAPVLSLA